MWAPEIFESAVSFLRKYRAYEGEIFSWFRSCLLGCRVLFSGATSRTHIFKPQIGRLPNGVDLSESVENEYLCLKLLAAFGIEVNHAEIHTFDTVKVLVVERFDRTWAKDGRLLRLPQEDCCQALSIPPTLKYQNEGGPGIQSILNLLRGSDVPLVDQRVFLKVQILFWLLGATDGHGKNFSLFLAPHGRFRMTPIYDVLSAQPSLDQGHIQRKQMKLAMSWGQNNTYHVDKVQARHIHCTAKKAGLGDGLVKEVMDEIEGTATDAFASVSQTLPPTFPTPLYDSIKAGFFTRLG